MEQRTSTGSVPGLGPDGSRDLRRVSDEEWFQVCLRWIDAVKSTFGLVAGGSVDTPEVRRAAVELADLGTPLTMALDKHGVDSRALWLLGSRMRAFAASGRADQLELARQVALDASSSVISVVNRLSVATDPQLRQPDTPRSWGSLDSAERRALILEVAGEGVEGGVTGVAREVAARSNGNADTIRRWIGRHQDVGTEIAGIRIADSDARQG